LAQKWTDRCVDEYGSDPLGGHGMGFDVVGQNNWVGEAVGDLDLRVVVDDWFSQRLSYDYVRDRCSSRRTCTDYTQVLHRIHPVCTWCVCVRVCVFHVWE